MKRTAIFLTLLLLASSVQALTFLEKGTALIVTGSMEPEDEVKIGVYAREGWTNITQVVFMNCPGGNVKTSLVLGNAIRERGFDTAVIGYCASACPFAFSGGVHRTIQPGGHLELHLPFIPDEIQGEERAEIEATFGALIDYLIEYLTDHGVDGAQVMQLSTLGTRKELYVMTPEDLKSTGFVTEPRGE